jgi:uncharacterized RDD family membrane protein YckC
MKAPYERRILAFTVDMILILAFLLISGAVILLINNLFKDSLGLIVSLLLVLMSLIASSAYLLIRDSLYGGRSIGKKVFSLRVVKNDGSRCDLTSSVLRNISYLIPFLNLIELVLPITDIRGMRVGDRIGRTQVIE